MSTYLMIRGMEPVELDEDESFTKVRSRVNQVLTATNRDGDDEEGKEAARPLHKLTFKTADGGRIAPVIAPEEQGGNLLAIGSDTATDKEDKE